MIYLLDNPLIAPGLSFNRDARTRALLEDREIDPCTDDTEPVASDRLLVSVLANPFYKDQKDSARVEQLIRCIRRFAPDQVTFLMEDLHPWTFDWQAFAEHFGDCQLVSLYRQTSGEQYHKIHPGQVHWVPHHLCGDTFRDRGMEKKQGQVLFYGYLHKRFYPERIEALETLRQRQPDHLTVIAHPGYYRMRHQCHTGELSRIINAHQACVVTASKFDYAVAKYFECLMSRTIPVGTSCPDIEALGIKVVPLDELQSKDALRDYPLEEQYQMVHENYNLGQWVRKIKALVQGAST